MIYHEELLAHLRAPHLRQGLGGWYFESESLLSDLQFGFRTGRSTVNAVSKILIMNVMEAFKESDTLSLTLCDLSRAFHCVSHPILLRKLEFYGLRGAALSICRKLPLWYVPAGVHQRCGVSGHLYWTGVPQGSVLGPFLFLFWC